MLQQAEEIITVSHLNSVVRQVLEEFPPAWVCGEISNFSRPSSGHWYFTLKDTNAQVRCAMFRHQNNGCGFTPVDGMQVVIHAKISVYEQRGDYQLIVDFIEPAGDGALQRAFQLLKDKLNREGLFDPACKKPLPKFPHCVGVITSPTGAAIRDILKVLRQRHPALPVIIYPTAVQGTQAAGQIIHALQQAQTRAECDVLIIARGGGSLEDLAAFNDEALARAIFNCPIPIVTGIGHEIDFSIADFVADMRAPTPSAAAMLICTDCVALQQQIISLWQHLLRNMQHYLKHLQQQLIVVSSRIKHPTQQLQQWSQAVDQFEMRLQHCMHQVLQQKLHRLALLQHSLTTLSPLATLDRGYAILFDEHEHVIESVTQAKCNAEIKARIKDGAIVARVEHTSA